MDRQHKILTNLGKDTHVREHTQNKFLSQNSQSYQMLMGEISIVEPEPLFKQTMVTVDMARGGRTTSVAYPNAFTDPVSGNIHGTYEGPIPGQGVMLGFENGNANNPFVVNRYPYQGRGNTLFESSYVNPLTRNAYHFADVIMGHFSGSYLSLNTGILPSTEIPGSVTLQAVSNLNVNAIGNAVFEGLVSAEVKGAIAKLTGTTLAEVSAASAKLTGTATATVTAPNIAIDGSAFITLNSGVDFGVKYNALKTAFDLLRTEVNTFITASNGHTHLYAPGPGAPVITAPPVPLGIAAVADMSAAQVPKVKL